jgi:hypothetical protein
VRSVSVVCSGFVAQANMIARLEGFPAAALAEYPGHPSMHDAEQFKRSVIDHVVPAIVRGLCGDDA